MLTPKTERNGFARIRKSLKRIVLCFNIFNVIFASAIPRMEERGCRIVKAWALHEVENPGALSVEQV
jgi:hypothetical protein